MTGPDFHGVIIIVKGKARGISKTLTIFRYKLGEGGDGESRGSEKRISSSHLYISRIDCIRVSKDWY